MFDEPKCPKCGHDCYDLMGHSYGAGPGDPGPKGEPGLPGNPTVNEIVQHWLRQYGYDGLYNVNGECGCLLDDLCPCGECFGDCLPGHKAPCDCGDHDYHVVSSKEEAERAKEEKAKDDAGPAGTLPKGYSLEAVLEAEGLILCDCDYCTGKKEEPTDGYQHDYTKAWCNHVGCGKALAVSFEKGLKCKHNIHLDEPEFVRLQEHFFGEPVPLKVGDIWQNGDVYSDALTTFVIGTPSTGVQPGSVVRDQMMCYQPRRFVLNGKRKKP